MLRRSDSARLLRRRGALGLGAAAAGLIALGASGASAATVSVRFNAALAEQDELAFVATAGENNRVELHPVQDASSVVVWTVSDTGAVLNAGESCRRIDDHTARCEPRGMRLGRAVVALGDLDDLVRIIPEGLGAGPGSEPSLIADGGDGNDELSGSTGASILRGGAGDDQLVTGVGGAAFGDTLDGGPGNDRLIGGPGSDRLRGGGGRDELHGGDREDWLIDGDRDEASGDARPGPDTLDGGPGVDTVSYEERRARVVVNLGDGTPDGEPTEGDALSQIESIVGGRGGDRLTGDQNPNQIDGGGGQNRLSGGGDDVFDNARGPIFCGSGDGDVVHGGDDSRDFPQPDCEEISHGYEPGLPPYPEVGRGQLAYPFSCYLDEDRDVPGRPLCAVTLRIREAYGRHRLLARGRLRRGPWNQRELRARLTSRGRRVASRRRALRAIVRIEESGRSPLRWAIRLRLPR